MKDIGRAEDTQTQEIPIKALLDSKYHDCIKNYTNTHTSVVNYRNYPFYHHRIWDR